MCYSSEKRRGVGAWVPADGLEDVWLVHYTERIGDKLATFTIVNWNAGVGKAKVPCCPAAISVVSPKHFQMLCLSSGAGTEKKNTPIVQ